MPMLTCVTVSMSFRSSVWATGVSAYQQNIRSGCSGSNGTTLATLGVLCQYFFTFGCSLCRCLCLALFFRRALSSLFYMNKMGTVEVGAIFKTQIKSKGIGDTKCRKSRIVPKKNEIRDPLHSSVFVRF